MFKLQPGVGNVHRPIFKGDEMTPTIDTDDIEVLREALAVAWGDSMTAQLKSHDQAAEIEQLRAAALNTINYLTGQATRNNTTDKSAADALRAGMAARA